MKIVITGAGGQLGKELLQLFKEEGYMVFPYTKQQLDITNRAKIKEMIEKIQPDYLINTAAFTQVDLCESDIDKAYLINGIGPYYLACEAKEKKVKFFHISTDYVFDGEKIEPYMEDDSPNPKTIYGKSKQLGEALVLDAYESSTIIRTSWLYGHEGKNFVNTIKKLARHSLEMRVVHDQYGCPTYTKDLGIALKDLLTKPHGIYHVTNSGSCSWFEFATEIVTFLKSQTVVIPVSTEEYGLKTPRPMYSVLSQKKLNSNGVSLRNWKEGLHEYLKKEDDENGH
ncbi:dTDP-4-dehydrorhamnose reductase [Peribacillus simplex]|uniref:dTDP-4-dehydrorhamnose reductase n=1 Tax=Peribacillus simplex TaxID=1478 RepID=UPI00298E1FD7|nr:dTDP-4-dehydrorhamnose reductase [Peribacillus simplex]MDW7617139.1 dTDP-4-dehydrorhamnose reductase [Peribacillus simplex]